jgi:acetyl esterase/lipase
VGVIYCHGSGWYLSDKDVGTRPFFQHLAAQGHVVMDVAYRMCPETNLEGMVADVKRAVVWMKSHGAELGVDPARVVLSGGSAGAHLAMLSAFVPDHPQLTPPDLADTDLSVGAIFSFYGPPDMRATAEHNGSIGFSAYRADLAVEPTQPPARRSKAWQEYQQLQWQRIGNLAWDMFGGSEDEVPERYDLGSPIHHVHAGIPPTLLIQGEQDILVSATSVGILYERMVAAGAPVAYLGLPNTDHAFDLVMPHLSPPSQNAWYEVDRFLALVR